MSEEIQAEELHDQPQASELELSAQISAALFVSSKPLSVSDLASASGYSEEEVEQACQELTELYQEDIHGISLKQVQGGYQIRTAPGALQLLRKIVPQKTRKFSKAAAETLAVIAYKQPVQRAEIEAIRGVDALPTLKTLLEAKVIRVIGRENEIGKPVLYATTEKFLERFGLKDLSELPTTREIAELEGDPGEGDSSEGELDDRHASEKDQGDGDSDQENFETAFEESEPKQFSPDQLTSHSGHSLPDVGIEGISESEKETPH